MELHTPDIGYRMLYKEKYISSKYPLFYSELMKLYKDSPNYNEKLYRYLYHIESRPVCPVCKKLIPYRNSPAGYGKYCSSRCMGLSENRKNLIKTSKIKKYGDPNYNNSKKATITMNKRYGGRGLSSIKIREKSNKVCIERYGVDNVFKLPEFQEKCFLIKLKKYGNPKYTNKEKRIQTCIERYGVNNPMKNKNIQNKFTDTMLSKYGVKYAMQNKNLVKKLSDSLIKSHKNGKYDVSRKKKVPSKIEKEFQNYLINKNIKFEYQYRSIKYPYLCDFYIPKYDLYIEIQGHWTHGKHPYTGGDDDLKIINKWKCKNNAFYDQAIYIWSIFDVKKRNIAKINNIRYLEIFSIKIDECIQRFNDEINYIKNG